MQLQGLRPANETREAKTEGKKFFFSEEPLVHYNRLYKYWLLQQAQIRSKGSFYTLKSSSYYKLFCMFKRSGLHNTVSLPLPFFLQLETYYNVIYMRSKKIQLCLKGLISYKITKNFHIHCGKSRGLTACYREITFEWF